MYSSHDYKKMVPFFLEIEFTLHLQVPFFVLKQTMQKIMKNPGPTVDGSEIPNKPPWVEKKKLVNYGGFQLRLLYLPTWFSRQMTLVAINDSFIESKELGSGSPEVRSTISCRVAFIHRRAAILSSPAMMRLNFLFVFSFNGTQ